MPALPPPPDRDAFAANHRADPLEEHHTEPDLRRRLARIASSGAAPGEADEPTQDLDGDVEEAVLFDDVDGADGVPLVLARTTQHPRATPAPAPAVPADAPAEPPAVSVALDDLRRVPGYAGCILVDERGEVILADGPLRGAPNLGAIGAAETEAWRALARSDAGPPEEVVAVTAERIWVTRPTDGGGLFVARFSTDQANVALVQLALTGDPAGSR